MTRVLPIARLKLSQPAKGKAARLIKTMSAGTGRAVNCKRSLMPPYLTASAAANQAIYHQHRDPDANCRVREIEGEPMPRPEMEIEEIDHGAAMQPVGDVADGAADHQPDRQLQQRALDPPQPSDQTQNNDRRQRGEHRGVGPRLAIEEAEAHAAIAGQHEIEEWREAQHRRLIGPRGEKTQDPELCDLIRDRDNGRGGEAEPHLSAPPRRGRRAPRRSVRRDRDARRSGRLRAGLSSSAGTSRRALGLRARRRPEYRAG